MYGPLSGCIVGTQQYNFNPFIPKTRAQQYFAVVHIQTHKRNIIAPIYLAFLIWHLKMAIVRYRRKAQSNSGVTNKG